MRWTVWFGLFALTVLATAFILVERSSHGKAYDGTTFDGYVPNPNRSFSAWLEEQRERLGERTITLTTDQETIDVTAKALGVELDTLSMLELVVRQRSRGTFWERLSQRLAAARGVVDYAWLTRFDRETARALLEQYAPRLRRAAVNAELDLIHRRQVRARSGTEIDVEATLDYIAQHRSAELDWVPLQMREVLPQVNDEDLLDLDISRTLSHFETDFRTRAGTRAVNIRVAARALNGVVLAPGATFSFNQAVGERVESRGFIEAPVIVDDELEPGVGGGVCQVATTLHAAAVLGGLDVLERRSHSRPSGYAPLGLDATVVDGEVDLKLRNPYRTPVAISATFPDRYRLRIELLGMHPPAKFEHGFTIKKRSEFYRRVITKPELPAGTFRRTQKGGWGFEVKSTVTAVLLNGTKRQRHYSSRYWPVPEVYWIGHGTALSDLPQLPDGAVAVQLDGTTVQGELPAQLEHRTGRDAASLDSWEL